MKCMSDKGISVTGGIDIEEDEEEGTGEGIDEITYIEGDLLISDNVISNNRMEGIKRIEDIDGAITITRNTISNNGGHHAIRLYTDGADGAMISDNEISDNAHGIWVDSSYNTIVRNMIERNGEIDTGVHLTDFADYNEIHENCFYDNVPQAWDDGTDNNWDGNYWSPPPGGPGNYVISGIAGSEDHNPLSYCPLQPAPTPVPELTPIGLIALIGLLSVIVAISIRKRKG